MVSSSAQAAGSRAAAPSRRSRTLWQDTLRRLLRDPVVVICVLYLALLIVVAIFPSFFATASYDQTSFPNNFAAPGTVVSEGKLAGHTYWMGADKLGRDIYSRLVYGTRVSISVAFLGAAVSFLIGVSYGLFAGYSRPRIDNIMMRIVDIIYAYPTLILIILLQVF